MADLPRMSSESTGVPGVMALMGSLERLSGQRETAAVYKMEANPLAAGAEDRFRIQAYEMTEKKTLVPRGVIFSGGAPECQDILSKLESGTIDAREVRERYIQERAAADLPDSPERFAADLYAHLSALADNKSIVFSADPEIQTYFLECLEKGYFESLRYILQDSAKQTGTRNIALMERLEKLRGQWEADITYHILPYFQDVAVDRAMVQARKDINGVRIYQETIFAGTTAHCIELAMKLTEGTVTAREVREMESDDWPDPVISKSLEQERPQPDEYPMPDPALAVDALERRGYVDGDLLPLSRDRAIALINKDMTVYILHSGKLPVMAIDREELMELSPGAICAILREEWEASQDFRNAVTGHMDHQLEREAAFLNHAGGGIVALKREDVISSHYAERHVSTRADGFLTRDNPLKNAELSMEDDCNMLDGMINNGPKEFGPAKLEAPVKNGRADEPASAVHRERNERKSILERLRQPLPEQRNPNRSKCKQRSEER